MLTWSELCMRMDRSKVLALEASMPVPPCRRNSTLSISSCTSNVGGFWT